MTISLYINSCKIDEINQGNIPLENLDININKILYIGKEYLVDVSFSPKNTTEKELIYLSLDNDILEIDEHGKIRTKNKGIAIITVKSKNRSVEKSATVSIYQIVKKPAIINVSEQWGPFEKIEGTNIGALSKNEIGINTGIEVNINPNTLIEDVYLINNGTVSTNNCEKENTEFNDVILKGHNIFIDNVTASKIELNGFSGHIKNSCFLYTDYYHGTLRINQTSGPVEIAKNVFYGSFQTFLFLYNNMKIENNLFKNEIYFYFDDPKYTSFKNNTIDIDTAFFHNRHETPNIDFSNNYWGTEGYIKNR
jgi:hypothetical protein